VQFFPYIEGIFGKSWAMWGNPAARSGQTLGIVLRDFSVDILRGLPTDVIIRPNTDKYEMSVPVASVGSSCVGRV
jgi:hypothetical protein